MNREPVLLPVRIYGDDVLRRKAEPIVEITPEIREFIEDLAYTMYKRDGVGMAAPQAGKSLSVFVVDTEWSKDDSKSHLRVLINPTIIETSGEIESEEGCLSLPGIYAKVIRPSRIRYSYTDLDGNRIVDTAEGWEAAVIQHEYDHLLGVLFTDRLKILSRLTILSRLKDLESTAVNGENIRYDIYKPEQDEDSGDD